MESLDLADVHGGLCALSEIAIAYKEVIKDRVELEDHLRNVTSVLRLYQCFVLILTFSPRNYRFSSI